MDYDSESSNAGDDGFAATGILLGYASKEATDDSFSQLGGRPVRRSLQQLVLSS